MFIPKFCLFDGRLWKIVYEIKGIFLKFLINVRNTKLYQLYYFVLMNSSLHHKMLFK